MGRQRGDEHEQRDRFLFAGRWLSHHAGINAFLFVLYQFVCALFRHPLRNRGSLSDMESQCQICNVRGTVSVVVYKSFCASVQCHDILSLYGLAEIQQSFVVGVNIGDADGNAHFISLLLHLVMNQYR